MSPQCFDCKVPFNPFKERFYLPEYNTLPARLRIEMPTRVAFRVTSIIESRVILDTPDATLLSRQGEMFFWDNLQLTKLQTINVIDDHRA